MSRILVFGGSGQLGKALRSLKIEAGHDLTVAPRSVDLTEPAIVADYVRSIAPAWIINAAAMTDVDGAHADPSAAMAVNGLGPGYLAMAAQDCGSHLVHISTEAVFDGERDACYVEDDACRPVSVYGASKLSGEHLVRIYSPESYVLRTSWLYAEGTGANFPTRLLAQLKDPAADVSVVTDIVGNPTPASVLAEAILRVVGGVPAPGTYHVCCTGAVSKFDWAVAIAESAGIDSSRISGTTSDSYPTVARRPKNVDLDCSKFLALELMTLPSWRDSWSDFLSISG